MTHLEDEEETWPLRCHICQAPATCVGAYEVMEAPEPACDECCGHGCEDGHCDPAPPTEAPRICTGECGDLLGAPPMRPHVHEEPPSFGVGPEEFAAWGLVDEVRPNMVMLRGTPPPTILLDGPSRVIWVIRAADFEHAMPLYHALQGWEPWRPMEDVPCSSLDSSPAASSAAFSSSSSASSAPAEPSGASDPDDSGYCCDGCDGVFPEVDSVSLCRACLDDLSEGRPVGTHEPVNDAALLAALGLAFVPVAARRMPLPPRDASQPQLPEPLSAEELDALEARLHIARGRTERGDVVHIDITVKELAALLGDAVLGRLVRRMPGGSRLWHNGSVRGWVFDGPHAVGRGALPEEALRKALPAGEGR